MSKLLVTGALGYIGSTLIPYLNEQGFETIGYDTGFFRDCTLWPSKDENIILKDMRHFQKSDLENIDTVIHLADISNDPFGNLDPEIIFKPTRMYTLKIAEMCKEKGIKFIFSSSCSIYGKASAELLTETSKPNPQTPYSSNKLMIEEDLKQISDNSFIPICLRFATAFGPSPRMRFDIVINMFVGMALATNQIILNSDGQAWRPNVYIKDVCKAIHHSIKYQGDLDQPLILNVGDTNQNNRILDLAKMVQNQISGTEIKFMKKSIEIDEKDFELIRDRKVQDGVDTRNYKVSFEAIKQIFKGFKCDWTIPEGISELSTLLQQRGFAENQLKDIKYYRLQKIEYLHKNKLINDDLFWTESANQSSN
ncbi:MAG: SDR family oxidoreductase [Candidatus Hodarchaeales archaeon]|jgi:nucleoside-diphosphate-sugar epimerase